jgi:preprotein translocase SecE subunit
MAVTRRKTDNLVETDLSGKLIEDIKKTSNQETQKKAETKEKLKNLKKADKADKQPGFLATTVQELKKANWPTFRYTYSWSLVIVLFTVVVSVSLGLFDHSFTNGIKFVDCTSTQGRNQPIQTCGREFGENILKFDQ